MPSGSVEKLSGRVLHGPNRWSRLPVVHLRLDLGELDASPTARIPGLNERLVAALPGLAEHGCSEGRPGGFLSRLREGTWMGHVVEHVALELQRCVGARTTRGKTRAAGPAGVYDVIFAFEDEAVGRAAGDGAIDLVNRLIGPSPGDDPARLAGALIAELEALAARGRLGISTQAIVEEARRRDIPVRRLDDRNLVQLGWGVHARRVRATVTSATGLIGAEIARDKDETSRLLERAAVPIPAWRLVSTSEEAVVAATAIGAPVVIKPVDGNHGRGVTLDLVDDRIPEAFAAAAAASRRRRVIVQRQVAGRDHRILVIGGRMVACAERLPAAIVGDGQRTVAELVALANSDPRRGDGHARALTRIALDHTSHAVLREQDVTEDQVPAKGRHVHLSRVANLSTGGTSIDRTEEVHPEVAAMAELAARVVGLDVAGIDVMTTDIAQPLRATGGAIIEINSGPGFRMHTHPTTGRPRNVGAAVIDHLFGPRGEGRIPVAAVTGSNGKTTTVRLLAHLLATAGLAVGSATTEDIVADGLVLRVGDMAGPASARLLLSTPTIEAAVLEVARGGILRDGLGYDFNDVAVVTNVTGDHLGLGGVETLQQLADVKAVVVDAVPRSGTAVLNADDPLVLAMAERCRGSIALVSIRGPDTDPGLPVASHLAAGGLAGRLESYDGEERLVIRRGPNAVVAIAVGAIPITLGGAARMHVANAMAAACAAVALGVDGAAIDRGLRSFASSPGRVERLTIHGRETILDYGHNIAALGSIADLVARIAHGRRVIGVVSMPGDRRDADRIAYGALAGTIFDALFVAEPAVRGRPVGEAAQLLIEAASRTEDGRPSRAGSPAFVADEAEAACAALCASGPDDLLVLGVADGPRVLARLDRCVAGSDDGRLGPDSR